MTPTHLPLLFREDQFDPVTRIRRGRLYNPSDGSLTQEWRVRPHPSAPFEGAAAKEDGYLRKRLITYYDWPAGAYLSGKQHLVLIALGGASQTLWRVIGIEELSSKEHLITLKSRSNMGLLPEIDAGAIPESGRKFVIEAAERVVDTAYRSGPESLIDRCRELATAALSSLLGVSGRDLGDLAVTAERQKRYLLQSCARTLAILHSRTKVAEQQSRGVLHPSEDDAELALQCVGAIIRESGWVTP